MSNRGIGHMKYKNLEINANIKSKVEMEKSSIDQEKYNNNNNNNNNNSNRLYWKVNFIYYIYAPEPSCPPSSIPEAPSQSSRHMPHNNIGRYWKETEKGLEKARSGQIPGAQGTLLSEVLCRTIVD